MEKAAQVLSAISIFVFYIFISILRKKCCQNQQLSKGYCTNNEVSHIRFFDWFFVERFQMPRNDLHQENLQQASDQVICFVWICFLRNQNFLVIFYYYCSSNVLGENVNFTAVVQRNKKIILLHRATTSMKQGCGFPHDWQLNNHKNYKWFSCNRNTLICQVTPCCTCFSLSLLFIFLVPRRLCFCRKEL